MRHYLRLNLCITIAALAIVTVAVPSTVLYAQAGQLTLSTSSGATGTYVTIYGTGFDANTPGYVFFDQDFDYDRDIPPDFPGYCGAFSDRTCEPWLNVTSDSQGAFTTSLFVPPGKKIDFLGAGAYQIGAELPIGGNPEGLASFTVHPIFNISPTYPTRTDVFGYGRYWETVTVSGGNFAPYKLSGHQSSGHVWVDYNNNYLQDGEPGVLVYVLPDGSLSACSASPCAVSVKVLIWQGSFSPVYIRANIVHEADLNRSTQGKVEASALFGAEPKRPYKESFDVPADATLIAP